jgi:calcineurin-like phosphoesterase family protein
MSTFFTSDLHLGHPAAAELRGFGSVSEHDDHILHNLAFLWKHDKLFILGDVAWNPQSLKKLLEIRCVKDVVLGNHDQMQAAQYLEVFNRMWGIVRYKQYWLTHCPIHPQEMFRARGNIHGHIHNGGKTKNVEGPYLNVNVDFNNYHPVTMQEVMDKLPDRPIILR